MRVRHLVAPAVLLTVVSACGQDATETEPSSPTQGTSSSPSPSQTTDPAPSTSPTDDPSAEPEPVGTTIEITVVDGAASTAGQRIEVGRGEPVTLLVTSDVAAELHVHSSPEQYLPFEAGSNDPITLTIDRPGIVEIELHDPLEGPVVELQVQ